MWNKVSPTHTRHTRYSGYFQVVYHLLVQIVLVRIDHTLLFTMIKMRSRGHSKRVYKPLSTKYLRMKSFSQRTINDWNNLPANVVAAPSLNAFKNRLDEHRKNICYTTTVI